MDLTDSELFWTRFYKGLVSMEETERYIRSLEKRIYNLEQIEKEHKKQNGELQKKIKELEGDYIPKSLVREKIEELEKGRDTIETFEPTGEEYQVHIINNEAIGLLEELLQEGDDK